ncbi:unnamed protein product [Adineta steineri]|uniref:F-box domain-containing protein n=1 Tax=Adineta steineri TaxID=433720 RepID=A0A814TSB4_9BILA|nr:unnamed protein product [Adineta steineri]CAF1379285.1 unnamed protein product [Adineta steineri]
MNLECLANEILLDLFEYFKIEDLFHTFYNVNYRFNILLLKCFHSYHLDFQSVSKSDFHVICTKYLPLIRNQIISLRFSDDDNTPVQSKYILIYFPSFLQLSHLRALSFYCINSSNLMERLIIEWHQLPYLTNLSIINCNFTLKIDFHTIINSIWSLNYLVYCYLNGIYGTWTNFIAPDVTSLSMQYLLFESGCMDWDVLLKLLKNTPYLRSLNTNIIDYSEPGKELSLNTTFTLTRLNVYMRVTTSTLFFWKYLPNLSHLTVHMERFYLDGKQWEYIIQTYLPKLKIFRLYMDLAADDCNQIEEYVDRLLNSFRSSFWLEEHQWYVRCHWEKMPESKGWPGIVLTTLPSRINRSGILSSSCYRSTCPDDNVYNSYGHVEVLSYSRFFHLHSFLFPNLHHLDLQDPANDELWSHVFNLQKLRILTFYADKQYDHPENELQLLLNRMPNLHTLELCLDEDEIEYKLFFNLKHNSIRCLDFAHYTFNREECEILIHSQLSQKCEVLMLSIKHLDDILQLINQLRNLRSLKIRLLQNEDSILTSSENELNEWLTLHLPSICDFRIHNGIMNFSYTFYVWIR